MLNVQIQLNRFFLIILLLAGVLPGRLYADSKLAAICLAKINLYANKEAISTKIAGDTKVDKKLEMKKVTSKSKYQQFKQKLKSIAQHKVSRTVLATGAVLSAAALIAHQLLFKAPSQAAPSVPRSPIGDSIFAPPILPVMPEIIPPVSEVPDDEEKENEENVLLSLFNALVDRLDTFKREAGMRAYPTVDNNIAVIAGDNDKIKKEIAQHALSARCIMHESTLALMENFINYKREYGKTEKEKAFYRGMNRETFKKRLFTHRPLSFYGANDRYKLRNGKEGWGGFENIGTEKENEDLTLEHYLSYDEMRIAALCGISGKVLFINAGDRYNAGIKSKKDNFQKTGVYTGLVGARFERPELMESSHMLVTENQNKKENGYGIKPPPPHLAYWATYYEEDLFPTFKEAQADRSGRFVQLHNAYLDTKIYKKRLFKVLLPFLFDAHARGQEAGKKSYCHVVGLGIGVWAIDKKAQANCMVEVYKLIVQNYFLNGISDIDFSHFPTTGCFKDKQIVRDNGNRIMIHFSKREPADKLKDATKELVAMYAWDGNSYPGNEFYCGALDASGDPAAASCCTLMELHNPAINSDLLSRTFAVE